MGSTITLDSSLNPEERAKLQPAVDATADAVKASNKDSTTASQDEDIVISYPDPSLAENADLVDFITKSINAIYLSAEADFWKDAFIRTNPGQVQDFIRSGLLALAWRAHSDQSNPQDIIGCVYVKHSTGEFGMLCCDPKARGTGVGRKLLQFAEDDVRREGGRVMRLEVLQGKRWTHEFKQRLEDWYMRNGYVLERVEEFDVKFPELATLLARPAVARCYRKEL
jgi:GNAT superfamily N-acetyltransferase